MMLPLKEPPPATVNVTAVVPLLVTVLLPDSVPMVMLLPFRSRVPLSVTLLVLVRAVALPALTVAPELIVVVPLMLSLPASVNVPLPFEEQTRAAGHSSSDGVGTAQRHADAASASRKGQRVVALEVVAIPVKSNRT